MKKTIIIYWTCTLLFAIFMIFTALPDILVVTDAKTFMTHLGYPVYIIPFLGVAKVLGSVAILIPSFRKIKEWAYAGLFFDLIGAVYSNIMVDGLHVAMAVTMPVLFVIAIVSYVYNQKVNGSTK